MAVRWWKAYFLHLRYFNEIYFDCFRRVKRMGNLKRRIEEAVSKDEERSRIRITMTRMQSVRRTLSWKRSRV